MADVKVNDNETENRYEAHLDGELAGFAAYRLSGDTVTFTHTEVDDAFGGKGVGSGLVRGALDDVRSRGLTVVPECEFVKSYIERHDEYADLVRPAHGTDQQPGS